MKFNILGSCVSRVSMLNGNRDMHGVYGEGMELGYFLDKENIVCAMLPSPFSTEEVASVRKEELWNKKAIHALKQCMDKSTVQLLMESDADFLVIDLYDFQNDFVIRGQEIFSSCAAEFMNTKVFRDTAQEYRLANFFNLPSALWRPYIDAFFAQIMEKYDADHIILNRFRSGTYYFGKNGLVNLLPDNLKNWYQCSDKYNVQLRELEEYIIQLIDPYVIDLSRYFFCDENFWGAPHGAHAEREFYRESYRHIIEISEGKSEKRCIDVPDFIAGEISEEYSREIRQHPLVIDSTLKLLHELKAQDDVLWMNLFYRLSLCYPNDARIEQMIQEI